MVTCICKGGLGNQLFQYAIAHSIAEKNNTAVQWYLKDLEEAEHEFNLPLLLPDQTFNIIKDLPTFGIFKRIRSKISAKHNRHYIYDNYDFNIQDFEKIKCPLIIDGYWQYESLFSNNVKKVITEALSPIMLKPSQMVAVHLRGGDYIHNHKTSNYHGNLGESYYKKAMDFFLKKYPNAEFHLFSNSPQDFDWDIFKHSDNCLWMDEQSAIKHFHSLKSYSNYIIANSSFSWWSAYINQVSKEDTIAPVQWFKNKKMKKHNPSLSSWIKV
jgi:hypothetical protein